MAVTSRPYRVWSAVVVVAAAGLAVLLVVMLRPPAADPVTGPGASVRPIERNEERHPDDSSLAIQAGFLGPEACAECHRDRVTEFQGTRHFLATSLPDPKQMPTGFSEEPSACTFADLNLRFEMSRSNQDYFETSIQRTATGTQRNTHRIAFCYGLGGGGDEIYFAWNRDRLNELPVAWISGAKEWGASQFNRHAHGDFSREMTVRCVECHNTCFDYVEGSRNQYRDGSQILGVTCEVCHGPGRDHVRYHRDHPGENTAQQIIQPASLSRERQMDLCAQCHSNALKHRGPAFGYRPGLVLDDFYFTAQTKHPEDDHVANQTTYLRQSRCFKESPTLTCITCHNPHQPRSASNSGTVACIQCHSTDDCGEHSRLPLAVREDCVSCHMPERNKVQVFFRTETERYVTPVKRYEHRIGIYEEAKDEILLKWYRQQGDAGSRELAKSLSAKLAASYRETADHLRGEYRYLAAIDACRQSLRFAADPAVEDLLRDLISIQSRIDEGLQDAVWQESQGRYDVAIETFERVLALKPDHAVAHAKLGTTYAIIKRMDLAVIHLTKSSALDPNDPYASAMLGWLAYLDDRPEEALAHYVRAERVEPYSAKINHQKGLAYAKAGRIAEAIDSYRKSLEINPRDARVTSELSRLVTTKVVP